MTGWPQFFDSSSPSVRARMSTAPPAGYGTNRCTAFVGNPVWAEATFAAATTPAAKASVRTHLMASLPRFYRDRLISRRHAPDTATTRRSRLHVDNPVDRV